MNICEWVTSNSIYADDLCMENSSLRWLNFRNVYRDRKWKKIIVLSINKDV